MKSLEKRKGHDNHKRKVKGLSSLKPSSRVKNLNCILKTSKEWKTDEEHNYKVTQMLKFVLEYGSKHCWLPASSSFTAVFLKVFFIMIDKACNRLVDPNTFPRRPFCLRIFCTWWHFYRPLKMRLLQITSGSISFYKYHNPPCCIQLGGNTSWESFRNGIAVPYFIRRIQWLIKVPIAANWKGDCLQNKSKPHSYYLKIWRLLWLYG